MSPATPASQLDLRNIFKVIFKYSYILHIQTIFVSQFSQRNDIAFRYILYLYSFVSLLTISISFSFPRSLFLSLWRWISQPAPWLSALTSVIFYYLFFFPTLFLSLFLAFFFSRSLRMTWKSIPPQWLSAETSVQNQLYFKPSQQTGQK